jgi:hypothetical protein
VEGCSGGMRLLQKVLQKGEVKRMVDRVHGAWRGGSPRKGSAVVFPCDFGEAGGSPTLVMDGMQRGRMEGVMHLFGGGERREGRKSWARWWLTLFKGGGGMEQGGLV